MKNKGKTLSTALQIALSLVASFWISGCSSSGDISAGVGTGGTGTVTAVAKLDVTDAPASEYAHVYVTVTGVAFHSVPNASFPGFSSAGAAGWQVSRLESPRTVDLAQLSNGTMYSDLQGGKALFEGMRLPVGTYRQIRIFLSSTEDVYEGSVPGLTYNNEVQLKGDPAHYPLRVPSASGGIMVVPESGIVVTPNSSTSLALDFNLNSDVMKLSPNGTTEFMLKPRLGFFDMERVGAITGTVVFGNLSTSNIEVKAEQLHSSGQYRVVRRMTAVDKVSGRFNLYPLPIFGSATSASYDILIRGNNLKTAIIKGVRVHSGTNISNGVALGNVQLQSGAEFTAQMGSVMRPTGAWLGFYQRIPGDAVPYEVLYQHLDPFQGKFNKPIGFSSSPVMVADYTPGAALAFYEYGDFQGRFTMVADAPLHQRGAPLEVSATSGQALALPASNPPLAGSTASLRFTFDMALLGTGMGPGMGGGSWVPNPTNGQIFVTHGGMIVDGLGGSTVNSAISAGGGPGMVMNMSGLPANVDGAVYGVYALGWGGYLTSGTGNIDLSEGGTTAVIRMR